MAIKKYYYANRARYLALKKSWDDAHRPEISARARVYYQKNKERIKAYARSYQQANRDVSNARTRAWHKAHPAESKANKSNAKHARRALEYATRVDTYGIYLWMKRVKSTPVVTCHWCRETLLGILSVFDHVIPISKGGPHTLENLCVCCGSCNSSKKNRLPSQWSVNGQTFLNL